MKVAMITGGQPRYTKYIFDNYYRVKGATQIDLYFYMWKNYSLEDHEKIIYCNGEGSVEEQINKGLPKNCKIKKFITVNEPSEKKLFPKGLDNLIEKTLGANDISHENAMHEILMNLYLQRYSIMQCFNLIDEEYDFVIRYRPDCFPANNIELKSIFPYDDVIYTPMNLGGGGAEIQTPEGKKIVSGMNDKFAIGNMKAMKIYSDSYKSLYTDQSKHKELVQQETSLFYHLFFKNNIKVNVLQLKHFMVGFEKGNSGRGFPSRI